MLNMGTKEPVKVIFLIECAQIKVWKRSLHIHSVPPGPRFSIRTKDCIHDSFFFFLIYASLDFLLNCVGFSFEVSFVNIYMPHVYSIF